MLKLVAIADQRAGLGSLRYESDVRKDKALALDHLPAFDGYRFAKHWPVVDAGVELAVFATRINSCRQVAQECVIQIAPSKLSRHLLWIDADDARLDARSYHLAQETARLKSPDRKQRSEARAAQSVFAVSADILQKEVTEGDCLDTGSNRRVGGSLHSGFILLIGARPRQRNDLYRQTRDCGLSLKNFAPGAVHGDPV